MLSKHIMNINSINETGFSFRVWCWPHNIMRVYLILSLLVGAAVADHDYAWKKGHEYRYKVQSRTLTGLTDISTQYTGILTKSTLTVQVKEHDTLQGTISYPQYARVHKELKDGWDASIPDNELEYQELPLTKTPFEIKLKRGLIVEMKFDKGTPTWEVNLVKAIVSQLQVDIEGQNAKKSKHTQVPEDHPHATFTAMEDSVGGKCAVLYDINPLPNHIPQSRPDLVPMPEIRGDKEYHMEVMKVKNYTNCDQQVDYHFGVTDTGFIDNNKFISKTTTSRVIITGNIKRYAIQSSQSTHKIFVRPRIRDFQIGTVFSRIRLTLVKLEKVAKPLHISDNLESVGNLVYTYNYPSEGYDSRLLRHFTSQESLSSSSEESFSDENRQDRRRMEIFDHRNPKPRIDEAPRNPLLPLLVAQNGRNNKFDPIEVTKDMITQIAKELDDPNEMPTYGTVEKFTIVTSLVRTMNYKQITQVVKTMHKIREEFKDNQKEIKLEQNIWKVFRDVIVQVGTGPALLTLIKWNKENKFNDLEASLVFSKLSKTARAPTDEYINELFEHMKEQKYQPFVNETLPLVIGEFIRNVYVSKRRHDDRYPLHSFPLHDAKNDHKVEEVYIPYMANELEKAIKEYNSLRAMTLIRTMGLTAHPKIVSIFEPYLEGKQPISTFQRTMMVAALSKLTETYPSLARSVLYKIYLNHMEAHEVRCVAIYVLMKTDPTASMLIRMALSTHTETNKHVISAIRTSIESAANLKFPKYHSLATKASVAKKLLRYENYDYTVSKSFVKEIYSPSENYAYRIILNTIGSEDTNIPKSVFFKIRSFLNGLKVPSLDVGYSVSSIKQLLDKISIKISTDFDRKGKFWPRKLLSKGKDLVENVIHELNIKPEHVEQLEGGIFLSDMYTTQYHFFDDSTIDKVYEKVKEIMKSWKENQILNAQTTESYDLTASFPTETGLPFIYSLKNPRLFKIDGEKQVEIKPEGIKGKLVARILLARNMQGKVGFITPFEHRRYIAGVHSQMQLHLPGEIEFFVDTTKKNVEVKLRPIQEKNIRVIHQKVVPFTTIQDIFDFQPITNKKSKNTQILISNELNKQSKSFASNRVFIEMENDINENDNLNKKKPEEIEFSDVSDKFVQSFTNQLPLYSKLDFYVRLDKNENVRLHAAYDSKNIDSENRHKHDSSEEVQHEKVEIPETTDNQPNSEPRRKQFMNEVSKGFHSGVARVMDLSIDVMDKESKVLTLGVASDPSRKNAQFLFYWNSQSQKHEENELHVAGQFKSRDIISLDFDKTQEHMPKEELNVEVKYGNKHSNRHKVTVRAQGTQTDDLRRAIMKSTTVRQCRKEMREGNKALSACQKANILVATPNQLEMRIDMESPHDNTMANRIVHYISNNMIPEANVEIRNPKNAGKNIVDLKMKFSPDMRNFKINMHSSEMDVELPTIEWPHERANWFETDIEEANEATCSIDKNQALTFDKWQYPVKLGNCWHAMMITKPHMTPRDAEAELREERKIAVLVREKDDDTKEVKLLLDDQEVKLRRANNRLEAFVDEEQVELSSRKPAQFIEKNRKIFEIVQQPDGSIKITIGGISVQYDGWRVHLTASNEYRNAITGLCGNFDMDFANDFLTQKKCLVEKPEHFVAMYALVQENCQGPVLENRKKAEKAKCMPVSPQQSNVVSDSEAGRVPNEHKRWSYDKHNRPEEKPCHSHRTKVVEKEDELCFTTRPVLHCSENCTPVEEKFKKHQLYCMPKNEAAMRLKERIEQGANPDMTHRPISYTQTLKVPTACVAA